MTLDKVGNISKQLKKRLVSHESGLVFMHGEFFKGGSSKSVTFKMELFATIGNDRNLQRGLQPIDSTGMLLR